MFLGKGWDDVPCSLRHLIGSVAWTPRDASPGYEGFARNRLAGVFCFNGTRANIMYAHLRTRGHTDMRIVHAGYEAVVAAIEPEAPWQQPEQRKLR